MIPSVEVRQIRTCEVCVSLRTDHEYICVIGKSGAFQHRVQYYKHNGKSWVKVCEEIPCKSNITGEELAEGLRSGEIR